MSTPTDTTTTAAPAPGTAEHDAALVARFDAAQVSTATGPTTEPEKAAETPPTTEAPKTGEETPKVDDKPADKEAPKSGFQAATEEGAKALTDVGLDYAKYAESYRTNGGKLTDADYAEMEAKNIPRSVVDAHIKGLVTAAEAEATAFRNDIFGAVGGEAKYGELVTWMKANVSADEIAAFDSVIDTGSVAAVKFAVQGFYARMTAAVGQEPQLLNGGKAAVLDVYESTYQMTQDMKDPRYAKDPAFRRHVEQKLARSNIM